MGLFQHFPSLANVWALAQTFFKLNTTQNTLTFSATTDLDFDTNEEEILSVTANLTFTGSNYGAGKHKTIFLDDDGSARTLTFPSGWVFIGSKPTALTASKNSVLTLTCLGSAEADVRASFAEES